MDAVDIQLLLRGLYRLIDFSFSLFNTYEFYAYVVFPLTFYAVIWLFWSLCCVNDD